MLSLQEFLSNPGNIELGDINSTGKSRIANLTSNGKPLKLILSKTPTLRTPYSVSSYDGASDRCSLDIHLTEELERLADIIDVAVLSYVKKNATRYFKTPQTEPGATFRPVRRKASREEYTDTFRVKITLSPTKCSAKAWGPNREPLTPEQLCALEWPSCRLALAVQISGCYFQGNSWGPTVNVISMMVQPEDRSCPFGGDDSELFS